MSPYESDTNNSSYRRASRLAEGNFTADWGADGTAGARATRKRQVQRREAEVHAACGCVQRRTRGSFFPQGILPIMKGIVDTGFIVAFARSNDQHHPLAIDLSKRITEPLLTCEAVLAEAAFHLGSTSYVLSLVEDELVQVAFELSENMPQLRELARRYADRKPDLADLCLIRMSELRPRHSVITVDESDFRVYRRNKRETLPLICPPRVG